MNVDTPSHIQIIGVNGQQWTISGEDMGLQGVELANDPGGLFDEAPFTSIWQQGAFQEGASYLGGTIDPIDMVLEFDVFSDHNTGLAWDAVEADFFASFDTQRPATIAVTSEMGTRTLQVLKLEKAERLSAKDPRLTGWSRARLTLRAPWPAWEGTTRTSTWTPTATDQAATITLFNPTDRPLWLQWAATAPARWLIPDHSFRNDNHATRQIWTPILTTGQDLTIDTYPRRERFTAADGSNVAGRFGGVDFLHPVPPRTPPTPVQVAVQGAVPGVSTLQVRMVEMWQRPEGGSGSW